MLYHLNKQNLNLQMKFILSDVWSDASSKGRAHTFFSSLKTSGEATGVHPMQH